MLELEFSTINAVILRALHTKKRGGASCTYSRPCSSLFFCCLNCFWLLKRHFFLARPCTDSSPSHCPASSFRYYSHFSSYNKKKKKKTVYHFTACFATVLNLLYSIYK